MVYSPRAATNALISMPVTWEEVQNGIHPQDFHLLNAGTRLKEKGDLFQELNKSENIQNLDFLLQHIQNH